MNGGNQLDPAAVERLKRLGGAEFVIKMIELFGGFGAEKVAAARQALSTGNLTAVADAVHPIKSSAGNVGARQVQELSRQIEDKARQSDSDGLPEMVTALEQAFAAHPDASAATDEAGLVARAGFVVRAVMGDNANIKVTTPDDVALVEAALARRAP